MTDILEEVVQDLILKKPVQNNVYYANRGIKVKYIPYAPHLEIIMGKGAYTRVGTLPPEYLKLTLGEVLKRSAAGLVASQTAKVEGHVACLNSILSITNPDALIQIEITKMEK